MKIVVVAFIILILFNLGSALYYLIRDKGTTTRTVKALTYRIILSLGLFVFLMASYYFGFFPAKGGG